ncbi:universal stress protein [Spirillospora sp. NPDC047279]|uniref:universal stress protein n=1 Tax=Spirillospora sp. NPDC047279 TaxID=3155478 RepID=UPI0033D150CC
MQVIPEPRRVVVGVDGSSNSIAALRRASQEAARRHARLDVVRVLSTGPGHADRLARSAREWGRLRALAARIVPRPRQITTRLRVMYGEPAAVLTKVAQHAELLVIGARVHSEHGNLLGGDTVPAVLQHAPCEVIICADHATRLATPADPVPMPTEQP